LSIAGKARLRSWPPCNILGFCEERFGGFRSGSFDDDDEDDEAVIPPAPAPAAAEETFLFFLEPPPTGTFLRDPPSVQYLLQVLQKYLGCVRL